MYGLILDRGNFFWCVFCNHVSAVIDSARYPQPGVPVRSAVKKVSSTETYTLNTEIEAYTQNGYVHICTFFVFKADFKQVDIQSIRNSKTFPYTQLTSISIPNIKRRKFLAPNFRPSLCPSPSLHFPEHNSYSQFY